VLDLADVLDEELARIDSSSLLGRIELPLARTLAEMEATGIAVDRAVLAQMRSPVEDVTVDTVLDSIASDGRIHTTFQTIAGTGAISSSDPNLHDIPLHPDDGGSIRDAFVPGDGYAELMTAGYADLDSRIVAHLSGDATPAKSSGVRDPLRGAIDDARGIGYCSTLLGRRRYLPDLDSRDRKLREVAERAALATLVQGSRADIVKVALINVSQAIKDAGLKSRVLLQVGDEMVFEVASGERETLATHVCEHLRGAYPLDAPLEVSYGYGPNWAAAAH
jgi:DNA polymerase I-like protein with 3'-5' exonuclease and polymerase domains